MQIFRGKSDKVAISSSCSLYGRRGGLLIAPFELALFKNPDGKTTVISSTDAGSIYQQGDTLLGTIEKFDNPQAVVGGVIKPVVWIKPKPSIDINSIPDVSSSKAPEARIGDSIILKEDISGHPLATGSIKGELKERTFKQLGLQAIGYYVDFNTSLNTQHLGTPVFLQKDKDSTLLGMLYEVEDKEGYVFPCEMIK